VYVVCLACLAVTAVLLCVNTQLYWYSKPLLLVLEQQLLTTTPMLPRVHTHLPQSAMTQLLQALCSSPVDLVTFLARRLAALAGTSSAVNDGLRTAGALQLLAALCYSPLPEARHLAAKALAGAGWNATTSRSSSSSGSVSGTAAQRRVLAAALRKEWDAWVAEICPGN
jgi:hypothetical protein